MRQNLLPIILGRPGWVFPGASVDRDFSRGLSFGNAGLTVTRASSQADYAETSGGVWLPFQPNTLRRTDKGALIEEARTNSIRNNSMQGASAPSTVPTNWSSTGDTGLTLTVNGVGTESGIDYIEIRLNGTTNATSRNIFFEDNSVIAAAAAQTWTSSSFFSIVDGDLTNVTTAVVRVWEYFGTTAVQNSSTSVATATAALSRFQVTRTFTDGTTDFTRGSITFTFSSGVAIDVTFRIGWPQLEQGVFASSPIRTTSAAVTRAVDAVKLTTSPSYGTAISFYSEQSLIGLVTAAGASQVALSTDASGSTTNRFQVIPYSQSVNAARAFSASTGGGSAAGSITLSLPTINTTFKTAAALQGNNLRAAMGGVLGTQDTAVDFPVGLNATGIGGSSTGGFPLNGYLKRVAIWPTTAIADATLQAITS
jgi:hypothetical protein